MHRPSVRKGSRPCEKTIAAIHCAIYCRWLGPRHVEDFRCTTLRAIGLLVFIRGMTFHTASPLSRPLVRGPISCDQ